MRLVGSWTDQGISLLSDDFLQRELSFWRTPRSPSDHSASRNWHFVYVLEWLMHLGIHFIGATKVMDISCWTQRLALTLAEHKGGDIPRTRTAIDPGLQTYVCVFNWGVENEMTLNSKKIYCNKFICLVTCYLIKLQSMYCTILFFGRSSIDSPLSLQPWWQLLE